MRSHIRANAIGLNIIKCEWQWQTCEWLTGVRTLHENQRRFANHRTLIYIYWTRERLKGAFSFRPRLKMLGLDKLLGYVGRYQTASKIHKTWTGCTFLKCAVWLLDVQRTEFKFRPHTPRTLILHDTSTRLLVLDNVFMSMNDDRGDLTRKIKQTIT